MKKSELRILMIGAGAIGGITAAMMKEKDYDVTLVSKYPELAKSIREKGLHIFGHCGNRYVQLQAVSTIDELSGKFDVVFIATKTNDMPEAAEKVRPLLAPGSRVVSMQNGIAEEKLAGIVGIERTVGCVVGFGATMVEPGELEMTSLGEMLVGYLDREGDPILSEIAGMLNAVVPTATTGNILSHLYSKLIINAASSTLGAITGLRLGKMLGNHRAYKIFMRIIEEAVEVANAMNLQVVPYAGKLNWHKLVNGPRWKTWLMIRIVGIRYRRLKSSSLQSLERGKKTEVDFFNGYIAGQGNSLGVPTPVNDLLISMVHEIEAGKRSITPLNLRDESFNRLIK
ncbi:MAG: 2-dehydropantoate 2-reductase [Bacteroidales bacterium]|nr:2-dehydropantoate 2-reductase [Bacteroidales bacterium]MBN2698948.1 2-dehydropantoate 2-reductase [Bacteroidales bacterium]